jgi:prevent-host-death family protein
MKTMTVAEFKARFSEVLESVKRGESVEVTYGRSKKAVAIVGPPRKRRLRRRSGGILTGKVSFEMAPGFEIDESELLEAIAKIVPLKHDPAPSSDDPIYRMCELAEIIGPPISNQEMDRLIYGV